MSALRITSQRRWAIFVAGVHSRDPKLFRTALAAVEHIVSKETSDPVTFVYPEERVTA